jgi:predicted GIY-YIG superfamily endonuclease
MSAWCYRVYDRDDRLIYVGATRDLGARLDQHAHRWWASQATRVKAKVYPTIADARTEERRAIRTERPRWNIVGRCNRRLNWSAEDYADYVLARSMGGNIQTSWTAQHLARVTAEYRARFGADLPNVALLASPTAEPVSA